MTQEKTLARLQWEQAVENEDFAQADKLFFKLKDDGQLDSEIAYVMGIWYRQMHQYSNSVGALGLGLVAKPDSYELYYEAGNTLMEMGMDEAAEKQYRSCLTLKPSYVDALYCLGKVLANQNKMDEAKAQEEYEAAPTRELNSVRDELSEKQREFYCVLSRYKRYAFLTSGSNSAYFSSFFISVSLAINQPSSLLISRSSL
mgnify:CR=1 FL=1